MTEQQAEQRSMYGTSDIPKYLRVDTLLPSLYDRSPESEFVNVETYVNALEDALQMAVEALEAAAEKFQRIQWISFGMTEARAIDGEQEARDALDKIAALQSIKEQGR